MASRRHAEPGSTRERRHGDAAGEATMRMLGGHFVCDPTNAGLLLSLLPPEVHVQASESGAERLGWIVRAIRDETSAQQPAGEPILVRLVEIMLIEALRSRPVGASAQLTGLLAGLTDPRLSIALRLLHEGVPQRWTVAALARKAGMSRGVVSLRDAWRTSHERGSPPCERHRVDLPAARPFDGLTNVALAGTQGLVFPFTCVHA